MASSETSIHTPGPWHVYDRFTSAIGDCQGWEVHVGPVPTEGKWPHAACPELPDGFRETFSKADAYLIAAAPDLLAELKRFHRIECPTFDDAVERCQGCSGQDAIDKAEGR